MHSLVGVFEHVTAVDVCFWSAASFVLVLLMLSVISALTRSTKNNVMHGLPRE